MNIQRISHVQNAIYARHTAKKVKVSDEPASQGATQKSPSYLTASSLASNFISFRGGKNNDILVEEIKKLKLEKERLSSKTLDKVVEEAKEILKKIKDWHGDGKYSSDQYYERAKEKAIEAGKKAKNEYIKGHNKVWQFFYGNGNGAYSNAYNSVMNKEYYSVEERITRYESQKETYENIVKLSTQGEEERKKRSKDIDELIKKNSLLLEYQDLQESIDKILSKTGGINDRIAGYQNVKDELNYKFVKPVIKSKTDPGVDVPPCVILYGPTGTGKTTLLDGIKHQFEDTDSANVINLSKNLNSINFQTTLQNFLENAKNLYNTQNKRTIILMNDAEQILSIAEGDADTLGVTLDDNDRNMLRAYGNNHKLINYFKSLLDTVSKPPLPGEASDMGEDNRCAASFFITTNYPHLIAPDLLSREGKTIKISVGLASNSDLAAVLRYHMKAMSEICEKFKTLKGNPNSDSFFDSIVGISDKGRENLKKWAKDGSIDKLNVDYENIDFEKLCRGLNPSVKEGAYSNDRIRQICKDSLIKYLEDDVNNGSDYRDAFFDVFCKTRRDINPERLKKFILIERMFAELEIDKDDISKLLMQKSMGLFSSKSEGLLQYKITQAKADLEYLQKFEKMGVLTPEQQEKKQKCEEILRLVELADKKDDKKPEIPDFE